MFCILTLRSRNLGTDDIKWPQEHMSNFFLNVHVLLFLSWHPKSMHKVRITPLCRCERLRINDYFSNKFWPENISGGGSAYSAEGGGGKNHDYLAALRKTLEFYDAQRAGEISEKYSVSWRQSATLQDKFDDSDLSGGFFDGAGTMKYTFPLAFSMNMLSWAVLEFEEEFDYHIDRVKELLKHGVKWLSETNAAHSKVKIKKVSVK